MLPSGVILKKQHLYAIFGMSQWKSSCIRMVPLIWINWYIFWGSWKLSQANPLLWDEDNCKIFNYFDNKKKRLRKMEAEMKDLKALWILQNFPHFSAVPTPTTSPTSFSLSLPQIDLKAGGWRWWPFRKWWLSSLVGFLVNKNEDTASLVSTELLVLFGDTGLCTSWLSPNLLHILD